MKAYVAAQFADSLKVRTMHEYLRTARVDITYDWTDNEARVRNGWVPSFDEMRDIALVELAAVRAADVVIVLMPGKLGTHVELGAALAYRVPVLIVHDHDAEVSPVPFYCHPGVRQFKRTPGNDLGEIADVVRALYEPRRHGIGALFDPGPPSIDVDRFIRETEKRIAERMAAEYARLNSTEYRCDFEPCSKRFSSNAAIDEMSCVSCGRPAKRVRA